ncbi:hypothetical protein GCM10027056_27070 [Glaciibacter psychrotolerans]
MSAVPIPVTAETAPASATEPRTLVTSVSTPTTVIANGSRLMKASGKKTGPPTRSMVRAGEDGVEEEG